MTPGRMAKVPSFIPLAYDMWGAWRMFAVVAGLELDVFTAIAEGRRSAGEIAAATGAEERAVGRLLDTLVALGYLRRKGTDYALTPVADAYLVRGSELYVEGGAAITRAHAMRWSQLTEVVRTGHPLKYEGQAGDLRDFWPVLVRSLFPLSYVGACAAVAAIAAPRRRKIGRILDVAAGSGAWSIAFAKAIPAARVTVVDWPEVTRITREYAERFGVSDRYDYLEGDLRTADFGSEQFDLVILGHIVHSEGPQWGRRLIEKSAAALGKGGMLLIADLVPNDERTGPPMPMLFALNMLINTEEGDAFTMRQYRGWLRGAGLRGIKRLRTANAPSPLILAIKP